MNRKLLLSAVSLLILCLLLIYGFTQVTNAESGLQPAAASSLGRHPGDGHPGAGHPADVSFLTGPNSGRPLDIVQAYLQEHSAELGLTAANLDDVIVTDQYTDAHNGVTHIYMRQRYQGIEIEGANLSANVAKDGSLINLHSSFAGNLARVVNATAAQVSQNEAVAAAAGELGLTLTGPLTVLEGASGPDSRTLLSDGGISARPISVRLVYHAGPAGLKLAWQMEIETLDSLHYWVAAVDALDGQLLSKVDLVVHDNFGPAEGHGVSHVGQPAGAPVSSSTSAQGSSFAPDQYEVFAMPSEYPDDGARVVAVNPADTTASPFGWHDTNGAAGAESTLTNGNNVNAYQDQDNDGNPEPGEQPDGGATLDFTGALVPLNLANDPLTYISAAITNLFYWNNIIHDVFYLYGFDEVSGNFQSNNYGNGGLGNDAVQAQGQDGSGLNNANFLTLPDGVPGNRMQMYLWNQTTPRRDGDLENSIIVHEYGHGISNRLTGGPANVSCLSNSEQMGEGWSDWLALVLTAKSTDTPTTLRGIGTYVLGQPVTGLGIRPAQYTYDMGVNAYTYANLPAMAVPHGVGFIWATMTWDMYWNLVNVHGFNPDFYGDWTTGGNNLAIQLVMDGMKLQPCLPGFVDGRNAILQADVNLTGGVNQCTIWEAFARRGLGFSASQGSSGSSGDGTAAFDIPPTCSFLEATPASQQICAGTSADFNVAVGSSFTGNVIMSMAGNPPPSTTVFNPNPVPAPGNTVLTIGNTAGVSAGLYTITITGTDGVVTADTTVDLEVLTAAPGAPTLVSPPDGATGTSTSPTLTWNPVAGASGYTVEVATDAGFTNIVHSNTVAGTSDSVSGLSILTQYFWRVRATNLCGTGVNSAVFDFTTGQEFCVSTPFLIPGTGTAGVASPYPSDNLVSGIGTSITDVNLRLEGLSHTWPDDIDMLLVGPQGQNLLFMSDAGGSTDIVNVELTFDDSAAAVLPDNSVINSGTYLPTTYSAGDIFPAPAPAPSAATMLATFNGTDPNGTWSLYIYDDTGADAGSMTGWCLDVDTAGGPSGDIQLLDFTADGYTNLTVTYQVMTSAVSPFALDFYTSTDSLYDAGDGPLSSLAVNAPADLAVGLHVLNFTLGLDADLVNDAAESDNDYYLLAVADVTDIVTESDADPHNEDNTAAFHGAYKYSGVTNVFVHGTDAADTILAGSNNLSLNGTGYYYGTAVGMRIRVHGEADVVSSNFLGPVALFGGPGNDLLSGGSKPDLLDGGEGDDTLRGRSSPDTLLGGPGNDTLLGDQGNDFLDGGADNDTAAFPGSQAVNANLFTGIATGLGTDTMQDIENLTGSSSRTGDVLIGDNGNNILDGGKGNDSLDGGLGADTLLGGAGNDSLTAGGGCGGDGSTDTVNGGAGTDTATDVLIDPDNVIAVENVTC